MSAIQASKTHPLVINFQSKQADIAVGLVNFSSIHERAFVYDRPDRAKHDGCLGHCFDGSRQAALMTSGFVFVDDLLVSDAVHRAYGSLKHGLSSGFVAGFNSLDNLLDCSTQFGTQAAVVSILFNCLTSALTSLCCVCHDDPLIIGLR
jgi:hypothetical protein